MREAERLPTSAQYVYTSAFLEAALNMGARDENIQFKAWQFNLTTGGSTGMVSSQK